MNSPPVRWIAVALTLSLLVISPVAGPAGEVEDQRDAAAGRDRLQGTWLLRHETDHGRNLDEQLQSRFTLIVEQDHWTLKEERGDADKTWKVALDPSHEPRQADFTCQFGQDRGKLSRAIYELKGETLRLCIADPGHRRPPTFDGHGNQTLLVFARKPSAKERAKNCG